MKSLHVAIVSLLVIWPAGMPAQQGGSTKAFTGARVIDGTARAPVDNATILVRGGRIVAIGPAVTIPADAERVPLAGKTIIPGLVNAHGKSAIPWSSRGGNPRPRTSEGSATYAAYGAPGISLGDPGGTSRRGQSETRTDRARLFVAGPVLARRRRRGGKLVDEDRR